MKNTLALVTTLALTTLFVGCKKQAGPEGPQGNQGPSGPVLTGNLRGYINHFDLNGSKIQTNLSGDTVKIDGTNTIAVTDGNGLFSFNGLSTGNYNLTVSKPGYGTTKILMQLVPNKRHKSLTLRK